MAHNILVLKAGGQSEIFSHKKLTKFLHRIQVPHADAERIANTVASQAGHQTSTKEIAFHTTQLLEKVEHGQVFIARYNLKESLRSLGPDGHPFETYVGKLFEAEGYSVKIGEILDGKCVKHEVDVYARRGADSHYVECKFHNQEGTRSDVVVALYTFARFQDLHAAHAKHGKHSDFGWLATNTKLTTEAYKYAQCVGLHLLNLDNPHGQGIMDRVILSGLYPLSSLSSLGPYLSALHKANLVLIQDLMKVNPEQGMSLGIPTAVLAEAQSQAAQLLSGNEVLSNRK